jgi:hypothetical protein
MVADVRLVHAGHGGMANFVGDNPEQVAFKGVRVEVDHALFLKSVMPSHNSLEGGR